MIESDSGSSSPADTLACSRKRRYISFKEECLRVDDPSTSSCDVLSGSRSKKIAITLSLKQSKRAKKQNEGREVHERDDLLRRGVRNPTQDGAKRRRIHA